MTLIVGESQQVRGESSFSTQLKRHAASMDLTQLMPVGKWSYGQGLRRAYDDRFYYELRHDQCGPFGLNHPLALRVRYLAGEESIADHNFSESLVRRYPALKEWKWTVAPREFAPVSADTFYEDSTVKCSGGWMGFSHLQNYSHWVVEWGGGMCWVASKRLLPSTTSTVDALEIQALAKLFLSDDVCAPNGRVDYWCQHLMSYQSHGRWEGLNYYFSPVRPPSVTQDELGRLGFALDVVGEELRASFALSMLETDVQSIMTALRAY